jgi:hypothetical protein
MNQIDFALLKAIMVRGMWYVVHKFNPNKI